MAELGDRLRTLAAGAGHGLSHAQAEALAGYLTLLAQWSKAINLTGLRLDGFPASSLDRLVLEPLSAAKFVSPFARWFDLGTGSGSPAIPLKVLHPESRLTMVESRQRKGAFLREVVRSLGIRDAEVRTIRFERLDDTDVADLVTVRGVRVDSALARIAHRVLRPGGQLLLFGATRVPELAGFSPIVEPEVKSACDLVRLERST